jgi:hypothetical protein
MKMADLMDEHGLKASKFTKIVMGIAWGGFGSILLIHDRLLASVYIALLFSFIFRAKIDYLNHGIGATIMLLVYIFQLQRNIMKLSEGLFFLFFFCFLIPGLLHDFIANKSKEKVSMELLHTVITYLIIPFGYSVFSCNPQVFYSLFLYALGYEITRFLGNHLIMLQKVKEGGINSGDD